MKLDRSSMLLYAVTDRTWLKGRSLADAVEEALRAGVTFLQLREKDLDYASFLELAREIKGITDKHGIPYVINDKVEVAMAVGADGVHVGQDDMAPEDVRKIIGSGQDLRGFCPDGRAGTFSREKGRGLYRSWLNIPHLHQAGC